MTTAIHARIDDIAPRIRRIAAAIGARPELGNEEFFAFETLTEALESFGFAIERHPLGLPTAFVASYDTGKPGPVVAFLAEYDALPDIGHACGHHLICSMSVAAAVGLAAAADGFGGEIRVYGTPAEETKGAKVLMAEAGMFRDCSFALMAHPYYAYERSGSSMAMDALRFEFRGKSAHAAANPEDGVNALDGVLQLFNAINALRQQTRDDARIHGVITNGGKAPNVIPDYACADFYVRAATRAYTDELVRKVRRCAEGAALATGCTLDISNYEFSYDELLTNETLSDAFTEALVALGVPETSIQRGNDHGSLDLGNVSLQCPAAHPYVQVVDEKYALHTIEFRDAAMRDRAFDGMLLGAKALASAAYACASSPAKLAAIREEFERRIAERR
ncbi:M20 family metallopeptidase [Paenibacillus sp.]|uniref:M20 family metallopeptidase n=1 Tax=Paenibacillus sp. TaxID=58172 RepID=UPI002D714B4A|nr:M20 family metallopeptidase [Paenibacillus sp.]HZG55463.1 M20 family metallopeptidase [Paenibacillus sp.]